MVSGLVVCCFECNQRPKPVCCMNDKCGDRQLASPVEECTWTRTICWNYPLCTPAQLWMCEMVISAYAPPFVMLARFNRHMLVWVSMGRRWNATAGKKRPSLCLSFFSTKQAERLVSTRGVWLWYVLIFSRLTFQTCSIDQQQGRDASNAAWGWLCVGICNVSDSTCENECHFLAPLGLRPGIQWRFLTFDANWNNAMRSGGCDRSIVPLIVSVRRVVAEKWP